jgi:uncharacterized protein
VSTGLLALLDDVVALSKLAAASLDDVAAQSAKAGSKAVGIVIDDAAVTPRYVVGLAAARELPIIRQIAFGSLKNKLLFLLPGALLLSYFAPAVITPLLMLGGIYLCLEGFHKVAEWFRAPAPASGDSAATTNLADLERQRIAGAIRTDFILSAEIMAITLAGASDSPLWKQGVILGVVGLGMTVLVYGLVALIVKADDAGFALAQSDSGLLRSLGRSIVSSMPPFLKVLGVIGTLAMLWVGGGIIIHGLQQLGWPAPEQAIHHAAESVVGSNAFLLWLLQAAMSGLIGLIIGALTDLLIKPFRKAY